MQHARGRYKRGLLEGVTRQRSREMRKNLMAAENLLWSRLRRRNIGVEFRRQYPILGFSPDFCCIEKRIVIVLDGDSHAGRTAYDAWRSEKLAGRGFRVLRFFNDEVQTSLGGVWRRFTRPCRHPLPHRARSHAAWDEKIQAPPPLPSPMWNNGGGDKI